jgi:hypothetical protein
MGVWQGVSKLFEWTLPFMIELFDGSLQWRRGPHSCWFIMDDRGCSALAVRV